LRQRAEKTCWDFVIAADGRQRIARETGTTAAVGRVYADTQILRANPGRKA
jgi:hypothetical protein